MRGAVFVSKKRQREEVVQRVSRGKRRRCLTVVAFLCDQPALQPLMPQIVIVNERTIKRSGISVVRASAPRNVIIVRQKSAWNNDRLCASIVRWLHIALGPHLREYQPILFMDAAPVHTTARVLAACRELHVWPIIIPASMTWRLQPLDTHALGSFKRILQIFYQAARSQAGESDIEISEFLNCVYAALRLVLANRDWAHAFDADGFGAKQKNISTRLLSYMRMNQVHVPLTMPSRQDFDKCFPRRSKRASRRFWEFANGALPMQTCGVCSRRVAQPLRDLVAITVAASAGGADASVREEHHALGRTRSCTRAMAIHPRGERLLPRRRSIG